MTLHRWSLPGRGLLRRSPCTADRPASSAHGPSQSLMIQTRQRVSLDGVFVQEPARDPEVLLVNCAHLHKGCSTSIRSSSESDGGRLAGNIPTTYSTVSLSSSIATIDTCTSENDSIDFSDWRLPTAPPSTRPSQVDVAPKSDVDELGKHPGPEADEFESHGCPRSSSSSYPTEGMASPVPGPCHSPQPTAYTMSIFSGHADYMCIPSEVGSYIDALYTGTSPADKSQQRLTLMDELAAAATANETSTTYTLSTLDLDSTSKTLHRPRSATGSTKVEAMYLQSRSRHSSRKTASRPERTSESSALPSTAYLICLLDDQGLVKEVENEVSCQSPAKSTASLSREEQPVDYKISEESDTTACTYVESGKPVPVSLAQEKNNVFIDGFVSEQSLTNEKYSELIKELPPLAKVERHTPTADNGLCAHSHTGIKTWLRYALCRTKTYCKTQLGRAPPANSTKSLLLFRTFRRLDRSKTSSTGRHAKKAVVHSLRLKARTWKWCQSGLATDNSTGTAGAKSYRRVVSCPA